MTTVVAERYELTGELGTGGMATVHRARDRKLGRDVAVKIMHREIGAQTGGRERFMREAKAAASFNHPGAVAVYDTGTAGGIPYIVMELVEGATLADVLGKRGALSPAEAVAVASQLLSALAAAHRRGLVHRDVKPANVLLPGGVVPSRPDAEPPVKLADFGIAKGVEQAQAGLTGTGQVLGTPKYISPEQVAGQPATPRSDVYAAGVLLYEMLAGAPPFTEGGSLAVALAHRDDPVPRLDRKVRGLDPGLVTVVHRALEKDPKRRFADGADMRAALADPSRLGDAPAAAATTPFDPAAAPTQVLADTTSTPTAPAPTTETTAPTTATRPPRGGSWKLAAVIGAVALVALALVAVDWDGLLDAEEPEEEEPTEELIEPDEPDPAPEPEPQPEPQPDEPDPAPEADEPDPEPRDAPAEEEGQQRDAGPEEDEQSSQQGEEEPGDTDGNGDEDTSSLEDLAAAFAVVAL